MPDQLTHPIRPFDWAFPYPSQRMPILARNAVATSQPLAAQAGLSMLYKGGNAVDAVLATAITLTVVEPTGNGIGSDAFAILWDGSKLHGLNASGRSPEGWALDRFKGRTTMPSKGWDAVTVPGAVSAWVALSERFGKLPFADLFEPAIRYAADGYLVSPTIARLWARQAPNLKDVPGFAEHFMPNGRAPEAGEKFAAPAHARTLKRIAETKGAAFYRGELAESMAAHSRKHGGAMTMADLAAHTADWSSLSSRTTAAIHSTRFRPTGKASQLKWRSGYSRASTSARSPWIPRQPTPADRGGEARVRRHLRVRVGRRYDARKERRSARQGVPADPLASHRHEKGADAAVWRARFGRHRLSHRRGRYGHDGCKLTRK
jgi:Gamma-glutamyltranspeptidase